MGRVTALDFMLTSDQRLFADTTRRFLEERLPIPELRALHERGGGFDAAYWSGAAELGWTAMLIPEAYEGGSVSGSGVLDLVLVAEEMGRLVSPGPLLPANVVADAIARAGTGEQKSAHLPRLATGSCIAAWAFDDGSDRWSAEAVSTTAVRDGDSWVLEGTKSFVEAGDVADLFLVTARTSGGLTQFLVPSGAPGLAVAPVDSLDLVRRFATVELDGVRVEPDALLGSVDGAEVDIERQLQLSIVIQNAETLGAVTNVFETTVQYCQDRIAFGRPIGSYQALKHRMADMKAWLEACHATATAAARAVQGESEDAAELVSVAKAYIADRGPAILQDCVQLHGGIGVTWEHDLHVYMRRVVQNCALYGDVSHHRERLASQLGM